MPLFAFLSGLVYAIRPVQENWKPFVRGKAKTLLIPLVVVGSFFAVVRAIMPGTNATLSDFNWQTLHVVPFEHFWFIQALFIIFVLISIVDYYGLASSVGKFFVFCAISISIYSVWQYPPVYFGLSGAVFLLPFFLIGLGFKRFFNCYLNRKYFLLFISVLIISLIYSQYYILYYGEPVRKVSFLTILVGGLFAILFVASGFKNSFLSYVGFYSYAVFLFHVFGSAGVRVLLNSSGINNVIVHLVLGLGCGLALPIIIQSIFYKNKYAKLALFGR